MNVRDYLEPIAAFFRSLGIPEAIVHWGHPLMMGIVIFVMGTFVGVTGWRGRTATDETVALESRKGHRSLAPWMFFFIAAGYTGGVLSLVMQEEAIFSSPHFWTGSTVIALLGINASLSLGFGGGDRSRLRTLHAYLGSAALTLMVLHTVFGLQLGISL